MGVQSRILLVDGDGARGARLAEALRAIGRVDVASSVAAAWETARREPLDVVVAAQRLGESSGIELLARLAGLDENLGRVLLGDTAGFDLAIESINRTEVHACLVEPCSPQDAQRTVRAVLARVELSRENFRLVADLTEKNRELRQTLEMLERAQTRVVHAEQLAAIGRMIAMIVHDLRTPIAVIRSAGDEIVRACSAEPESELARLGNDVVTEALHMQRTCSDLLDVTRASESADDLVEEDLDEVVGAALAHFADEAARAGVRLDLDLASGATVALAEDALRRALRNLARNALEAMPSGGLLRVESRVEGDEVRLTVSDDGPGLPDEIRDRLFEPFASHGKPGGSGLGLAIVKKVVEDHHGRIEAGKPPGGGTAFHLLLPLARPLPTD